MLEGDCAVAVHHLHVGVERVHVGVPVVPGQAGGQGGQEQGRDRAHRQVRTLDTRQWPRGRDTGLMSDKNTGSGVLFTIPRSHHIFRINNLCIFNMR